MGIENQYLGNPNLKKAFVSQEFNYPDNLVKQPQWFRIYYIMFYLIKI
jgi:hypothetical protein